MQLFMKWKIQSDFLDSLNIENDDFSNIFKIEQFLDSVTVKKFYKLYFK